MEEAVTVEQAQGGAIPSTAEDISASSFLLPPHRLLAWPRFRRINHPYAWFKDMASVNVGNSATMMRASPPPRTIALPRPAYTRGPPLKINPQGKLLDALARQLLGVNAEIPIAPDRL
jgi:hypothetical protein